jgi:hypothetical protein
MPISISGAGTFNGLALPTDSLKPGLVHINTTTFSAVSSVSLDDVFSAEYDSYLFSMAPIGTARSALRLRFRSSGSDDTNAAYQAQYLNYESTTAFAARETNNTNSRIAAVDISISPIEVKVFSPFLTQRTVGITHHGLTAANASSNAVAIESFGFSGTTSFDGFTLFPGSGTMTGTIRVYGYRNDA